MADPKKRTMTMPRTAKLVPAAIDGAAHGADELVADDHVVVLFGGTGDLARRKLLPGLFHLAQAGLLPERYRIIATSRGDMTDQDFRELAKGAVEQVGQLRSDATWQTFAANLSFASRELLVDAVADAEAELGNRARRLFYLSVPPVAAAGIVSMLDAAGLTENARVILEKPFGIDLASARALNQSLHAAFDETHVFRIDHFLGKETVQNILALRFANGIFEPIWNRDHIEHVQIDVPETLSIGTRAPFYEQTGAYRDMIVTHLLQVLGFVAMEPPTSFSAKALLDETVKVAESLRPISPGDVVYGQYTGYRDEDGVAANSQTETFVAARVSIDNWRWAGVPFYLRTGKRMAETRRVVTIAFRDPPRRMFQSSNGFGPNELVFELGDPGRISTSFLAKVPGPTMRLGPARFTFDYNDSFTSARQLEAYERLIHDALIGDRTLFTRADGIERLWEVSAPLLAAPPSVHPYRPGSWGPAAADRLIEPRRWHLPEASA
jgi:glucose-6-phosphate 1-dehydrogenase